MKLTRHFLVGTIPEGHAANVKLACSVASGVLRRHPLIQAAVVMATELEDRAERGVRGWTWLDNCILARYEAFGFAAFPYWLHLFEFLWCFWRVRLDAGCEEECEEEERVLISYFAPLRSSASKVWHWPRKSLRLQFEQFLCTYRAFSHYFSCYLRHGKISKLYLWCPLILNYSQEREMVHEGAAEFASAAGNKAIMQKLLIYHEKRKVR